MAKAVFIQSSHSPYGDIEGVRYHFPNMYLSRVAQTVGDWVILYEGRRGGSRGYYAVQRIAGIVPDPSDEGHSFALTDPLQYWEFETAVPRLRPDGTPWESGLPHSRGSNTSAVRIISDRDFAAILAEGMRIPETPERLPRTAADGPGPGFRDASGQESYRLDIGLEDRIRLLTSRAYREASFARQVKRAYGGRCAVSGLALRNGAGRMEVEAAHILPVAERGPDIVRNGLALSGTVHWMFDRGLISAEDDGTILIARDTPARSIVDRLVVPGRRLLLPADPHLRPAATFLKWHRDHRFKG